MIRSLRTVVGNYTRTLPAVNYSPLALVSEGGAYQRLTEDISGSLWYSQFSEGVQIRMGQVWKPNKVFSNNLLNLVLERA